MRFIIVETEIPDTASINDVQYHKITVKEENKESNVKNYIYPVISVIFKTLIVSLMVVFFVNKFRKLRRTENVAKDLLKLTGKGLAVLILVPIISFILLISYVGTAFSIVVVLVYLLLLYIATSIISIEIAYRVLSKKEESQIQNGKWIGVSVLVALIISIIGLIPTIGGIVKFILILMGLGMQYDIIFQREKVNGEVNEN